MATIHEEDEADDLRDPRTQDTHMAHVAQLVEHVLGKDEVTRSIRVVGSTEAVTSEVGDR